MALQAIPGIGSNHKPTRATAPKCGAGSRPAHQTFPHKIRPAANSGSNSGWIASAGDLIVECVAGQLRRAGSARATWDEPLCRKLTVIPALAEIPRHEKLGYPPVLGVE